MPRITRRDALALPLSIRQNPTLFYTSEEFIVLKELTEIIIPADETSPGAGAAGVPAYIAMKNQTQAWKKALDHFARLKPSQRPAELARIATHETNPSTALDHFFVELKRETAKAYWTSKLGIHQDLDYKGNVIQPGEYAGFDPD